MSKDNSTLLKDHESDKMQFSIPINVSKEHTNNALTSELIQDIAEAKL